jgi:hypothetical protein
VTSGGPTPHASAVRLFLLTLLSYRKCTHSWANSPTPMSWHKFYISTSAPIHANWKICPGSGVSTVICLCSAAPFLSSQSFIPQQLLLRAPPPPFCMPPAPLLGSTSQRTLLAASAPRRADLCTNAGRGGSTQGGGNFVHVAAPQEVTCLCIWQCAGRWHFCACGSMRGGGISVRLAAT